MEPSRIYRRQSYDDDYWWYSSTAYVIKWAVIAALLVAFLLYFVGGYLHARRRMKKGLPPLAYHRWLIPRRSRLAFAQAHPEHAHHFSFYRTQPVPYGYSQGQAYPMPAYGPPPPAYHEPEYVPAYTPQGPNKTNPDQGYAPPVGAPPPNAGLAPPAGPTEPERAASPWRR